MGRAPCCDKANVKKGPWSPEEDDKLKDYIQTHGTGGNWIALPKKAGLRRCGKSCRLRWLNYLRPNIKHGEFSDDEDKVICALFASIGSRWSVMAAQLPGRTDNDIKNYWNTKLKKKMMNSLMISMPHEIRKQPLHDHLQPFNSSTNYSYPSLSVFHTTSNVNINAPLSPAPPPTPPPLSSSYIYSTNTTVTSTVSDSDGSCHYDQYAAYDHHNMRSIKSDSYREFGANFDKEKGFYEDLSLDTSLEEIKQLISTNLCSSNIDNNLNFFVDETKDVEKVMYY